MISSLAMAGLLTAIMACLLLPVGCIVFCIKKGGKNNLLFIAIIGFAALTLSNSLVSMLASIDSINKLADSNFLVYAIIITVLICALESLARYLAVHYIGRNGIGFYQGFAIGTGFAAGMVILRAMTYFQLYNQAKAINAGTFIDAILKQGNLTLEEIEKYQQDFSAILPGHYFVQALTHGAMVAFQIALVLLLIKFIREGKKILGLVVTAGIRIVYEIITTVISYSSEEQMNNVLSKETTFVVAGIFLVLAAAASVFIIITLSKKIPVLDQPYLAQPKKPSVERQKQQDSSAWQEFRKISHGRTAPGTYSEKPKEENKETPKRVEQAEEINDSENINK